MNTFRDMRRTLYHLKRDFGKPITWRKLLSQANDDTTGLRTTSTLDINVRAIILPREQDAKFTYSLTYLALNKNFGYGAMYDCALQDFIFDTGDFPVDFHRSNEDMLVLDGKIYQIQRISAFDIFKTSIIVTAKYTEHGQEL